MGADVINNFKLKPAFLYDSFFGSRYTAVGHHSTAKVNSSGDRELWLVTLTFKHDLDTTKVNPHASSKESNNSRD